MWSVVGVCVVGVCGWADGPHHMTGGAHTHKYARPSPSQPIPTPNIHTELPGAEPAQGEEVGQVHPRCDRAGAGHGHPGGALLPLQVGRGHAGGDPRYSAALQQVRGVIGWLVDLWLVCGVGWLAVPAAQWVGRGSVVGTDTHTLQSICPSFLTLAGTSRSWTGASSSARSSGWGTATPAPR